MLVLVVAAVVLQTPLYGQRSKVYHLEDLEQLIVALNPAANAQTLADLVDASATLEGIQALRTK